jgi:hypothetical protein
MFVCYICYIVFITLNRIRHAENPQGTPREALQNPERTPTEPREKPYRIPENRPHIDPPILYIV